MKIKRFLLALSMMVLGLGVLAPSASAKVSCPTGSTQALAPTLAECNIESDDSLWQTVKNIINVTLGVIAVIAVIMIIIGGIEYTASRGDATKTKKGKDTIIYSVIGLVIALLAFAIVNFVLSQVFNNGKSAMPKTEADKKATSYIEVVDNINQIN